MPNSAETVGPVAIGGVGGSGTRVIAAMVSGLGYQVGADLDVRTEDDLTFSILFKRPRLYRGLRGLIPADHRSAVAATRAFVSLRSGHRRLSPEILPMLYACAAFPYSDIYPIPDEPLAWPASRLRMALRHSEPPQGRLWMWKEPNTLLFLPTLFREIPGLRYIHVVRNGLSMAKSKNNYQLTNWGYLFDLPIVDESRPQQQQLVYWARVNLAVAEFLSSQPRSLVVSHERTVMEPMSVVEDIAAFLGRPNAADAREVANRVRRPDDFERSYQLGANELTGAEKADVERALDRFGYGGTAD